MSNLSIKKWAPILLGLGAFWLLSQFFQTGTFCYFKATLGFPCPGCGMTRSVLSLFRGDIHSAFYWHPLWPLILIYPALYLGLSKFKKSEDILHKWLPIGVFAMVLIVYATRMYFYFPHQAPFDYNKHALLYQWINLIKNIR